MAQRTKAHQARLLLLLGTVGWGLSFPLVKVLRGQFSADGISHFEQSAAFDFVRFSITSIIYALYLCKTRAWQWSRADWALGWRLGVFGSLALLFQVDGMAYTDPGTSAFLTQMTCVSIPLIALLTRKKKLSPLFALGVGAGFCGLYLLSGFDIRRFTLGRGEAETLLTAFFYTLQILSLESPKRAKSNPVMACMCMFLLFAVLNLPFFSFSHLRIASVPPFAWMWMMALVLISSLLPFVLMAHWQPFLSSTEASFIYSLESIFALILNFTVAPLLLKFGNFSTGLSGVTSTFLVGALLLVLANIFLFWESSHSARKMSSEIL